MIALRFIVKYRKRINLVVFVLGCVSLIAGFHNFVKFGVDCQIEGANYLLAGQSPYSIFFENPSGFRFSRFPTHLPQSYYILLPFSILGDYWGYVCYGVIGLSLLIALKFLKQKNRKFLILVFALFATTPFRNNLGNGQYLFFFFGLFIVFDYLITNSKSKLVTFGVCPLLLLLLAGKPISFFWIPLFYTINKKNIIIYVLTVLLQLATIFLFAFHTGGSFKTVLLDYAAIASQPAELTFTTASTFSIMFDHWLDAVKSIFVFLNAVLFLAFLYLRCINKVTLTSSAWLFTCITISLIVVYHNNYDSFLLLTPLFLANKNPVTREHVFLIGLFIYMVFEKAIFILFPATIDASLNNLLIVLFTLLIQIDFLKMSTYRSFSRK